MAPFPKSSRHHFWLQCTVYDLIKPLPTEVGRIGSVFLDVLKYCLIVDPPACCTEINTSSEMPSSELFRRLGNSICILREVRPLIRLITSLTAVILGGLTFSRYCNTFWRRSGGLSDWCGSALFPAIRRRRCEITGRNRYLDRHGLSRRFPIPGGNHRGVFLRF